MARKTRLVLSVLVFMLLLEPVSAQVPKVDVAQTYYSNIKHGSTITLGCTVSSSTSLYSVYWEKEAGGSVTKIRDNTDRNKYGGGLLAMPSLIINNADINDNGIYRCFATNRYGTGSSKAATVVLENTQSASATIDQQAYSVNIGGTVTLKCKIFSTTSLIDVYWHKTDRGVVTVIRSNTNVNKYSGSTTTNPSLTIYNAVLTDKGEYICHAVTGSSGTVQSKPLTLSVVSSGSVPKVTVPKSSYSVLASQSVVLTCSVTSTLPLSAVYWQKDTSSSRTTINSNTNVNKYTGSATAVPSLTILNADKTDEGSYICFATNNKGETGQSIPTKLTVSDGGIPKVDVPQNYQYEVNSGNSITLQCTVQAMPKHTSVYWNKRIQGMTTRITVDQGKYIGSSVSNPSLTITRADKNDEGYYTCLATNSFGTGQSANVYLDVIGGKPVVKIPQNRYSVSLRGTLTLTCTVSANPAYDKVYWKKIVNGVANMINIGNRYSGSTIISPSLTIRNVEKSDEGYYVCYASNNFGTGNSQPSFLYVEGVKPIVNIPQSRYSVSLSGTVTLTCMISADPPFSKVYWKKIINGVPNTITISNRFSGSTVASPSLTIMNADQSDEGYYMCYASNSVGTGNSQQTFLQVQGSKPIVNIPQNRYSVSLSGTVTLICVVSSDPPSVTVFWKRIVNGVLNTITIGNRYSGSTVISPSLTIRNAEKSDEGYYVCYASNSVGTGNSQQTFLQVKGTEPSPPVLSGPTDLVAGNNYEYTCVSRRGNPKPTMSFKLDSSIVTNGISDISQSADVLQQVLRMTATMAHDGATLYCQVDHPATRPNNPYVTSLTLTVNEPLSIVAPQTKYSSSVGSSVILLCEVRGAANSVTWYKDNNKIDVASESRLSHGDVITPSLTITDIKTSDGGHYVCSASGKMTKAITNTITLAIQSSPLVKVFKTSYTVKRGKSVTLECVVTSNPPHTRVSWTRNINSQTVTLSTTGSQGMLSTKYGGSTISSPSLIIYKSDDHDEGAYTCHATNDLGTGHSSQTFLKVETELPTVMASFPGKVSIGNSVIIRCVVLADPKETSIRWQRMIGGVPMTIAISANSRYSGGSVDTPSLTIDNVQESDQGEYMCQAINAIGTGSSERVHLKVTGEAPRLTYVSPAEFLVKEGEEINSTCYSTAFPEPKYSWYKDDNLQIFANGRKLVINKSKPSDKGKYTCHAVNSYGVQNASFIAVVMYTPSVRISNTTSDFRGVVGNTTTIPCHYNANPDVTSVTWKKITGSVSSTLEIDGNKYEGGKVSQPDLTIHRLASSDTAKYQCTATNPVGSKESEIVSLHVDTEVAPYDVAIVPANVQIILGRSFTTTCSAKGAPVPTFTWYHANREIGNGPTLSVSKSEITDEGQYTCTAENSHGKGSDTVEVEVRYAPISTLNQSEFDGIVGKPVTLACSTRGKPAPSQWTWGKDGTALNHYLDTYVVDMDSVNDFGTYTCKARNAVGDSSLMEFKIRQAQTVAGLNERKSDDKLSAGEIAAIVCGVLAAIAITSVCIICCYNHGCFRRRKERVFHDLSHVKRPPTPRTVETYVKDPIYLDAVGDNVQLVPQYRPVTYVEKEPIYMSNEVPRYVSQPSEYLPVVEYYDYDYDHKRSKKSKHKEPVFIKEKVVESGDIYHLPIKKDSTSYREGSIYHIQ